MSRNILLILLTGMYFFIDEKSLRKKDNFNQFSENKRFFSNFQILSSTGRLFALIVEYEIKKN